MFVLDGNKLYNKFSIIRESSKCYGIITISILTACNKSKKMGPQGVFQRISLTISHCSFPWDYRYLIK